jgi:predicted acetyltransferase
MGLHLQKASKKHITVLQHLMQFYMYDFSVYTQQDVEENGLFAPYTGLESYWDEGNNKFPYIIKKDDKYIGFALIKLIEAEERSYFSVAEFFILRKYRLQGAGKAIAIQLFTLHKGRWEVYQMNINKPAQLFWNKVIKEFTKGKFRQHAEDDKQVQSFES